MTRCRRDDPDYIPLICADDTDAVKEMSDINTCASRSVILVTR